MRVLRQIGRNANALPPEHPKAGEMVPRDGVSEYRWAWDDNGMLLSADLQQKLNHTVACAMNGDTGSAAWVFNEKGDWFTVNLSVAGYGGKPRWSANINGMLRGGYLIFDEGSRQRVVGMPGFETINGQVAKGNYLDPRKIQVDHGTVVHHHYAPPEHVHHGMAREQRVGIAAAFRRVS